MTDRELMQMALDALENAHANEPIWKTPIKEASEALRSRLANEFNPDWNQVEALQESLREHMAEIQRLRARLVQPEQEPVAWMEIEKYIDEDNLWDSRKILRDYDNGLGEPLYTAPPQPKPERYTTDAMKIKQAVSEAVLQQAEQEPTAYLCENAVGHKYFRWKKPSSEYKPIALYTAHASPQRIWQGLTDGEVVDRANAEVFAEAFARGVAWAELKLKEKNNG